MFKNPPKKRTGFTLIELLVVIAIIGILATITLNVMSGVQANAKASRAEAEMNVISNALEAYKAKYGDYPWIDSRADGPTQLYQALIGERVPSRDGGSTKFGNKTANAKAEAFIDVTKFSIYSAPDTYVGDSIEPSVNGDGVVTSYDDNSASHYIGDPWGNPYYYYYKSSNDGTWEKMGFVLISRGDKPGNDESLYTGSAIVPTNGIINTESLPEDAIDDIIIGK